jgi:hypothetical protein
VRQLFLLLLLVALALPFATTAQIDPGGIDPTRPGSGGGHIVQDEGATLPVESKLNFKGAGVSCIDNPGVATECTITGAVSDNAEANGVGRGIVTFAASEFDCTVGLCTIDWTNIQKASGSLPGPLTAADWTTFNGKAPGAASYLTATAEAGLSAEVNLGALATGYVKCTVAGGVCTPSTVTQVNLASEVTGNLAVASLNSGTGASGTTFWAGDGTWKAPNNSGTAGRAAYYPSTGTVVDDATGLTFATDGTTLNTVKPRVTTASGNATLTTTDGPVVACTTGAGNITLTLPVGSSTTQGTWSIVKVDSGAGQCLIAPNGADTINGVNSTVAAKVRWSRVDVTLTSTGNWSALFSVNDKDCSGTGHILSVANGDFTCSADSAGAGAPAGSDGNTQYKSGAAFAGSTGMNLDGTTILSVKNKVTALSTNTTLGAHNVIAATVGAGGITLTLPAAASTTVGHYSIVIVDTGTGNLTLAPNGTDKLNGVNASKARTGQFGGFQVDLIDGTNGWWVSELYNSLTKTIQVDAALCNNATAYPGLDLPTANAPTPTCLTGGNTQQGVLDYADGADSSAQFSLMLPTGWVLGIDADVYWLVTASGGSNAVKWTLATGCGATGETYNSTFNAAQTVTTNVLANDLLTKSSQASITTTGCAAGEEMHVKIGRDTTDTFTGTARLKKVVLTARIIPQP